MKLATSDQMRAMDRRASEEFGVPGLLLMENAAIRIADAISERYGKPALNFVVLCGSGNNGGDGLAVARQLVTRYGASGTIWLCGEPGSKSTGDRDVQLDIATKMGLSIAQLDVAEFTEQVKWTDIVIDAMLGTGSHGDLRPTARAAADVLNDLRGKFRFNTVAVDIPSGIDADTGAIVEGAIYADFTVTLGLSKIGLHLAPAYEHTGEIVVGDLAYPKQITGWDEIKAVFTGREEVAKWLPDRVQTRDTNKGKYGSVTLFAGSEGFAGAPTLCCLGAARSGAGLVTLGVPNGILDVMMARLPDEIMARGFSDSAETRRFSASAVDKALEFVDKMDVVGIGPGIGHQDKDIAGFVTQFVARCSKPMVIDADALNCLAAEPDHGASILKSRTAATLLTPHPGEMGRLLGMSTKDVQSDRLNVVRIAAETFGCIALLKGDRTLIAAPDGRLAINSTGNAGMASGGMGDILTGIMATFAAQIDDPFEAAAAAAYVHGLAGDMASDEIGKAGLMASDLGQHLPAAIRRCFQEGGELGKS